MPLSTDHALMSYWDIIKRGSPRKSAGEPKVRRRCKTQDGDQFDGIGQRKRVKPPQKGDNGAT
ncbi:hypothetical protein BEN30_01685 [Magnetovibrio blakemorei]|uniref:Uncharacterized protein n=1 Tax=Magnetovibrio blakemorei TaxID=28181 RepID=A0A1E5Q3L4_9PROT|nr:hypothetical protein BEN30_01685 [Magnetovibrio blakemorei]